MVRDGHLRDPGTCLVRQRRKEPMHLAVQSRLPHDVGPICLERAPVVVQPHTGDPADQPVRDAGRQAADESILPLTPPPTHDVVPFVDLLQQPRDVCRVVLEIAVHRHDHLPAGVVETGRHRRRLAEVTSKLDELQTPIMGGKAHEPRVRLIATPVVHDDDLEGSLDAVEGVHEQPVQRLNVVFLVVYGNDDGDLDALRLVSDRFLRQRIQRHRKWVDHTAKYEDRTGGHPTTLLPPY